MIVFVLVALVGLVSGGVYLVRRKWINALLVAIAAAALAGLTGELPMPANEVVSVTIDSNNTAPRIGDAAIVRLLGDGLRASQWRDLPARKLDWKAPIDDGLRLDFPRIATPGRMFRLTASMAKPASRRLQLIAENGQLVAETSGEAAALTVQWMPPVAETLLFKARLLDAAGKVIAQGPVPFEVRENVPLQVQGRFASPSFDASALNTVLAESNAVLDWQVTLGKTVTRSETARAPISKPELLVYDAANIEKLSEAARAALLARVAEGTPLLVLGGNASQPEFWSKALQLHLKEQPEAKASGAGLALMSAPFNPDAKTTGAWISSGDRIWSRPRENGRIVWVGVSEWHRYAISAPQSLGLWWQDLLDRAGVRRLEEMVWQEPEEMPLPFQRMEVCALGAKGEVSFPELKQTLAWQRRPDKADASCVAVWPRKAGWLKMQSGAQTGQVYVYDKQDWPLWQKSQRRDATMRYAARTPSPVAKSTTPMPSWPFALVFVLAMLLLWWREQR